MCLNCSSLLNTLCNCCTNLMDNLCFCFRKNHVNDGEDETLRFWVPQRTLSIQSGIKLIIFGELSFFFNCE